MAEIRKMTMGEIAELAGLPKETLRSRINRGVIEARKAPGWARFDLPTTMQIVVHAEMMRRIEVEQIAFKVAEFVSESVANFCNYPPRRIARRGQFQECYLFFRRHDHGDWTMLWVQGQKEALHELGGYVFETSDLEASGFYFLNVSTVADWALDRIFDLQEITGNHAEVPQ